MKATYVLILLVIGLNLKAQGTTDITFNLRDGASNNRSYVRSRLPVSTAVDFNRYLYDAPRPTMIVLLEGDTIKGQYKYNIENETLESADGDSLMAWNFVKSFQFLESEDMEQIKFSNLKLVWPEGQFGGFIQDVSSSDYVKVKYYLEFIARSYDASTQMGTLKDKVISKSETYMLAGNEWKPVPTGKTAFFDFFGRYSEPLRRYARKNRLKHTRPEDIGKMVTWITKNGN